MADYSKVNVICVMLNEGTEGLEKQASLDRVHDPLNATGVSTFNGLIQLK